MTWVPLASGLFASNPTEIEGPLRVIHGISDIVEMMGEDQGDGYIAVTNVAGGSAVSTIIRHTKAIVSTIGGPNSHIVVVARDYNVPCIVGAENIDLTALENGTMLRLAEDGALSLWRDD